MVGPRSNPTPQAVRGNAAGAELQRTWASIKLLEAAGRCSSASRALESSVLNVLWVANQGGLTFGSVEHNDLVERQKELARRPSVQGAAMANKEAFDSEFGLGLAAAFAIWGCEGFNGYSGPMTRERVVQSHSLCCELGKQYLKTEAVAPDQASAIAARSMRSFAALFHPRQHALDEFSAVTAVGEGGAFLRETIER